MIIQSCVPWLQGGRCRHLGVCILVISGLSYFMCERICPLSKEMELIFEKKFNFFFEKLLQSWFEFSDANFDIQCYQFLQKKKKKKNREYSYNKTCIRGCKSPLDSVVIHLTFFHQSVPLAVVDSWWQGGQSRYQGPCISVISGPSHFRSQLPFKITRWGFWIDVNVVLPFQCFIFKKKKTFGAPSSISGWDRHMCPLSFLWGI